MSIISLITAINSPKVLVVAAAALSVAALAAGAGHLGYDASYALLWGHELAGGALPAYRAPVAPTPHPLAILAGAALSPLGVGAAGEAWLVVTTASLGGAAWAAARIAGRIGGAAAAMIALAAVLTRPQLVAAAWRGSIDLPALVLVLLALDALLTRPARVRRALWLLVPAGLLRPETWALSVAIGAWAVTVGTRDDAEGADDGGAGRRVGIVALAVAAPIVWLLWDLVVTGDPLFSLHGTRALADQLDRPRTAALAPTIAGPSIRAVLGVPLALAGIGGLVLLARRGGHEARLVIGVVLASLLGFGVLGLAGLPLLARYLLVPAVLLAICAAVAAAEVARSRPAAIVAGMLLLVAIPGTVAGIGDAARDGRVRRATQTSLRDVARGAALRDAVAACAGKVAVGGYLMRPEVARGLDRSASGVARAGDRAAALVLPASGRAVKVATGSGSDERPLVAVPAGARLLTAPRGDWAIASCGAP